MMGLRIVRAALAGWVLLGCSAVAEPLPPLWGYGVKSCDHYVRAWQGKQEGREEDIAEFRRYQDWLTGYVSGLNLATGQDVLAGVAIDGAMRRIHLYCDDHRKDDFFGATMDLVKLLSLLK